MVELDLRLKRLTEAGLEDWLQSNDPDAPEGLATSVADWAIRSLLAGTLTVRDDYSEGECLAEQTGAGAVLTFTFSEPRNLVLIEAVGSGSQVARVDPFGGTPTSSLGIRADDGVPLYLPVTASSVKVYTPSGMVVSVAGFSRA